MLLAFLLFFSPVAHALTAVPLEQVLAKVESTRLVPLGHALLFGHLSIESCAYGGEDLLVIVEYCYPDKPYEARAVSMWSRSFGIVELYAQDFGRFDDGRVKRDVRINQFPELTRGIFEAIDFSRIDFPALNGILEKLYDRQNPGCWSTNLDYGTMKPDAGCFRADLTDFPAWTTEAGAAVRGPGWERAYARVMRKLGLRKRKP